jgi:hypothetical protein
MLPVSGLTSPAIKLIKVVLPLPVGPSTTIMSVSIVRFIGPNVNDLKLLDRLIISSVIKH